MISGRPVAVLLGCLLVMTTGFVARLAWGNAAVPATEELGLTIAQAGWLVSAFYAGYIVMNATSGFLADRFGGRVTLLAGMAPLALALFAFSRVNSLHMGLLVQGLMGLSAGVNHSAGTQLVGRWFAQRGKGLAFGILLSASSLGVIVANATLPTLIQLTSWRTLYSVLAGVVVVALVIAAVLVRDETQSESGERSTNRGPSSFTLLREHDFLLLSVVNFAALWGTWGMLFWINALMVKGRGFSIVDAGLVATVIGIGGLVSKPAFGWISDVSGLQKRLLLAPSLLAFGALLLAFGFIETRAMFILFAGLIGLVAFSYNPVIASLTLDIAGRERLGSGAGLLNALGQCGVLIVPVVVGYIFQATGSFLAAFATLALGPVTAAILVLQIAPRDPSPVARTD